MNRLPAFPYQYDVAWGNTFIRTLETNLNELSQPISSGWNITANNPTKTLDPTSAIGQVGNVAISTNGSANTRVVVTGVGGAYSGTLQNTDSVLETLISDMKIRGLLA
jgi:thiamine biosynthesis lipoprotein ApbE